MNIQQLKTIYNKPLLDLIHQAQTIHKQNFDNDIELCSLKSIKTGACPEDCKYCPQSGHYNSSIEKHRLLDKEEILEEARKVKASGSRRFCMGAAWKNIPKKDLPKISEIITSVKNLGLETCVTLGSLNQEDAIELKNAGLDYYNHNLDTSREFYPKIISTRKFDERIETIRNVANANINVCCGGILGMGESIDDRLNLLMELLNLPSIPQSIPINTLIPVKGTPLGDRYTKAQIDNIDLVRFIALTRILFPKARLRLSAGREDMSIETQTLCFTAGINSIFYGNKLLTENNASINSDDYLIQRLGLSISPMA
ncbi:biotin synthase BioB [Francisella adeliensis]|uniref:Biotin synthase n=1 Tax=Francisella adeliensis TaxID=2007306 RepID=A0A2Z4Y0F9_9GAMM|nr:biotin synthase BioB [Francisella adeliensis]AXA34651.1 biotin synthase BioB [Francisella adeliensis]MBK2086378.1 biotin synthase BioB [Francisella adeliensis]MBK2096593.1 biotin synthase BioB [Francisella adeliensis]QIW12895.1 biotin synthase BioB [Francisella adeliensis]QIW14771.1 biotin synthase BioB [Francisella adeliensis]